MDSSAKLLIRRREDGVALKFDFFCVGIFTIPVKSFSPRECTRLGSGFLSKLHRGRSIFFFLETWPMNI